MKDNWKQIKIKISESIKDIFDNASLPNNLDIELFIELFKNVLLHKTGNKKLDGLGDSIIESLHEIYFTKPGGVNQLENIIKNIEPFLKKILFIKNGIDYTNDKEKTLVPCLKELNILKKTAQGLYPKLDEINLLSFKGSSNYLEHICRAYNSRNQIHNAPKLKPAVVYEILDSGLVVYIYAIIENYSIIVGKVGENLTKQTHDENYMKYALSVLSYNPSVKMLESDFGVKMQSFDDFEIKVKNPPS